MNTDAAYNIGKSHDVCQDYAFAANIRDRNIAIISDGCSSSPHTDIGARILTHTLVNIFKKDGDPKPENIISKAELHAENLGLPSQVLDATLLYIKEEDNYANVCLSGDGVIAAKDWEGNIEIWDHSQPYNAPPYLGYLLDDKRLNHYEDEFGGLRFDIEYWKINPDNKVLVNNVNVICPSNRYDLSYMLHYKNYQSIAIFSDGISTFRDSEKKSKKVSEIIPELMGIKTDTGQFVQRRFKRFLKTCDRLSLYHEDDLSMAALSCKSFKECPLEPKRQARNSST